MGERKTIRISTLFTMMVLRNIFEQHPGAYRKLIIDPRLQTWIMEHCSEISCWYRWPQHEGDSCEVVE